MVIDECNVKCGGQNLLNRVHQIRPYPAPVAALIEPFQAPVLEALLIIRVYRKLYVTSCQVLHGVPAKSANCVRPFFPFDVETVFLFPWAVRYRALAWFGVAEVAVFLAILIVGSIWVYKKGALDWV